MQVLAIGGRAGRVVGVVELEAVEEFCPAKVNLFLAVTGRRADGFHELVSLMAPLDIGDRLRVGLEPGGEIVFSCNDPALPLDEDNLVLRAVEAFRRRYPFRKGLRIELEKRIPVGAGLGGGSSDAAGMLLALNRLLGSPLDQADLHRLAAEIGSDCPFFLEKEAAVARGRGERISPLPEATRNRLRGVRLLLVKPSFSISTAWAYGALARMPDVYLQPDRAEGMLAGWMEGKREVKELLFNNMEPAVFRKFIPLPTLKERLEAAAGVRVLMSGSGSAMVALLENEAQAGVVEAAARDALGDSCWLARTRLG